MRLKAHCEQNQESAALDMDDLKIIAANKQAYHTSRLSVAPMMDWTDRHCRYFHRLLSHRVLLYTEMVTAAALVRGKALHLLDYNNAEHPLALQLGGADPKELAAAAKLGQHAGYDEINLICSLRAFNLKKL